MFYRMRESSHNPFGIFPSIFTMKGATADPTIRVMATTPSSESWATTLCPKVGCKVRSSTTREMSLGHLSNGTNPKTLTMRNRVMAMSQRSRPTPRKSSSIIVTTSAAPPISPMLRPTSPSSMPTCPMANCSWTNIPPRRRCRTSSMARNSTRKRDCTIMAQGT